MIISQQSSSSSSGSSSSNSSADLSAFRHQVFLSFHGKDTRTTFTGYLYEALTKTGIRTYRDDEDLRQGRFIRPELLQAIESSASAVVVFSPNYVYSKWCLDELTHIVKCKEEKGLLVYPVFYHVDPSDVRHSRGSFERAFDEYEGDSAISYEKSKTWKSAFRIVGGICGTHVRGDRYEHEHVSDIVTTINRDLQDVLITRDVIRDLVGIESRVNEVRRILCLQSDDVRFVGIYGMSGAGKTFLAYYVYDLIRNQFDCCSFVHSIKDVSVQTDDLRKLQQQIVRDLLGNNNIRVANVMDGVRLLQRLLHCRKSLIVLDDVNRRDQLNHLAGKLSWFGTGSRIIITTTDEHVLHAHGVEDEQKYKCDLLENNDARRLFCKEAFGKEHPKKGFEDLTDDIVRLAGGLPLALVVFGSALSGEEDERYWRETLQKLQQYPDKDITGRLEVCYHRLGRHEQEVFIYLACFLNKYYYSYACNVLNYIGFNAMSGISILRKRSLVGVRSYRVGDQSDQVYVHEQLIHMCWEILRKEAPKPRKRMALDSRKDIVDILKSKKGGKAIRIINDESYEHEHAEVERFCGHRQAFSKMTRLMLLRIHGVDFPDGIEYLSSELRHLDWNGCSLKSFPPTFEPRHLLKLLMRHSKLEHLWENVLEMPNLEEIDLSESKKLTKIPDLSMTPKLKSLYLNYCMSLVEVHPSVVIHNSLEVVQLSMCKRLENLGSKSLDMEALRSLYLNDCSNLQMIPKFGERTRHLKHLNLAGTNLKKLPSSICQLEQLRDLYVQGCHNLDLSLSMNTQLEIPPRFDLDSCDLSGNESITINASFCDFFSRATFFYLNDCKNLRTLPNLPRSRLWKENELQVDFCYLTSAQEIGAFQLWPINEINGHRIISCFNCPRLVENESGRGVAVAILKKYMQVGNLLGDIPQASFEIYAAGSEISPWFSHYSVGKSVLIDLPNCNWYNDAWIGIALCAVIHGPGQRIGMPNITPALNAYIYADGRHIEIPFPILRDGFIKKQVVRYVSITNHLRQSVDWSQIHQLSISFEPNEEGRCWNVKSCAARMVYKTDLDEFVGEIFEGECQMKVEIPPKKRRKVDFGW